MLGVTQADPDVRHAALSGELLCTAFEDHERLTAPLPMDIDVAPTHRFTDAGAERFRDRFLGSEACREMARGIFHGLAIRDFAFREDAVEEALTETLEGMLDALGFDQIDSDSQDAHGEEMKKEEG